MAKGINKRATKQGLGKKTSIGNGKRTKFKALNSNGTVPKGYRKKYRGQGK
tara:strand:+ start:306 stop:458 length:153 start_codon:yes stop_codon:yes gene_type:complete